MLKGVTVPRTGRPGRTGIMLTKTLLWAGERGPLDTVNGEQVSWFRSYDKATGAIVSEMTDSGKRHERSHDLHVRRQAIHRRRGRGRRQAGGIIASGASIGGLHRRGAKNRTRRLRWIALVCLSLFAAMPLSGQYGAKNGEWRSYAARARKHQIFATGSDQQGEREEPSNCVAIQNRQFRPASRLQHAGDAADGQWRHVRPGGRAA